MPKKPIPVAVPDDLAAMLELTAIKPGEYPHKQDVVLEDPPRLPDNDVPDRQPMPERDPRDPVPQEDPDNPPPTNGDPDEDSSQIGDVPESGEESESDEESEPEAAENEEDDEHKTHDEPEPDDEEDEDIPPNPDRSAEDPTIITPSPGAAPPAALGPSSSVRDVDRPSAGVRYESRIQILDAFQYPGSLKNAPDWVDRNWTAYAADYDPLREIDPGPCLRVPLSSGLIAICRVGDFVCRQSVTLAPGLPSDVRIEVWDRTQFEKLFVPTPQLPQGGQRVPDFRLPGNGDQLLFA